jgi:hypothetical protein
MIVELNSLDECEKQFKISFIVKWQHYYEGNERVCKCVVRSLNSNLTLDGYAFCSENDNYEKNKGRKISLSRAIVDFPNNEREQIWKQYGKEIGF